LIAAIRPDAWGFPLFLHIFGAMILFGATLATVTLAVAGRRSPALARSAFWSLLAAAIPAWVLMRVGAQWIYSKEGFSGNDDPTWLGIGFLVADLGLVILLLTTGFAFWWQRSRKALAANLVAGLSAVYLVLLVVAWLAMSGKWG
jgi:hypothetical protein